jgi:hypothetical protein
MGNSAGVVSKLHIIIHFRTRVFSIADRLANIHAMLERFLHHHHPPCGGDVLESIERIKLD